MSADILGRVFRDLALFVFNLIEFPSTELIRSNNTGSFKFLSTIRFYISL